MKTKTILFSVLVTATVTVHAQITRYETNNLKKIAYVGQTTGCQQRITDNGGPVIKYEAIVPMPETTNLVAPPVISVLAKLNGEYAPLATSVPYSDVPVSFNNGNAYLHWKDVYVSAAATNIYFTDFMIALITEGGINVPSFTLGAAVNAGSMAVSFSTETGKTYALEYTHTLGPTNTWQVLTNGITGTGGPVTITDTNAADRRFYRGKS